MRVTLWAPPGQKFACNWVFRCSLIVDHFDWFLLATITFFLVVQVEEINAEIRWRWMALAAAPELDGHPRGSRKVPRHAIDRTLAEKSCCIRCDTENAKINWFDLFMAFIKIVFMDALQARSLALYESNRWWQRSVIDNRIRTIVFHRLPVQDKAPQ